MSNHKNPREEPPDHGTGRSRGGLTSKVHLAGRTGSISIAYVASIGAAWLPGIVKRLTHDFPGVRLDLRLNDGTVSGADQRADIELVVDRGEAVCPDGFVAEHLLEDPYVVVTPEDHPLAAQAEVPLSELVGERWIDNDFSRGWCRQVLLDGCAAAGFSPYFHVEAHDYRAAIAFAAAGVGITVLPLLGASDLPAGVVRRQITPPAPTRSISAIYRDTAVQTPQVATAVALLRASTAGGPRLVEDLVAH